MTQKLCKKYGLSMGGYLHNAGGERLIKLPQRASIEPKCNTLCWACGRQQWAMLTSGSQLGIQKSSKGGHGGKICSKVAIFLYFCSYLALVKFTKKQDVIEGS